MGVPLVTVGWRAIGGIGTDGDGVAKADIAREPQLNLRRLANGDADGVNLLGGILTGQIPGDSQCADFVGGGGQWACNGGGGGDGA